MVSKEGEKEDKEKEKKKIWIQTRAAEEGPIGVLFL